MNPKTLMGLKYLFFATLAFFVPKAIVESGRLVAPLESNMSANNSNDGESNASNGRSIWPFRLSERPPKVDKTGNIGDDASNASDGDGDPLVPFASEARAHSFDEPAETLDGTKRAPSFAYSPLFARSSYPAQTAQTARLPRTSQNAGFNASYSSQFNNSARRFVDADRRFLDVERASESTNPFLTETSYAARPATKPLAEIFRFDRSPAWFVDNWARVDATRSDDGLLGSRVPVSTGPDVDDLVGTLTCYFDATRERRIVFSGQTGDYRKTLRFLEREYGVELAPESTAERLVFESTLRTTTAAPPSRFVVRPTRVFLRESKKSFFDVDVVLERPYN